MSESPLPGLIRQTALLALAAADRLLLEWLPEGKRNGREWMACNSVRGDRRPGSFGVSLDTGKWNDFADDAAHGSDLVSLLAYLRGCKQLDAAREIDQRLGLGLFVAGGSASGSNHAQVAMHAQQEAKRRQDEADAELQVRQRHAARHAAQLWSRAKPADRLHAYLQAKQVPRFLLRQLGQGRLLIPLCSDGHLVNLQIIHAGGEKRFLPGGRVQGCYSPLGKISEGCRLYVCEGWATGATLHEHTGSPVVCAMNAGNLKPVAKAMRDRYGDSLDLVIAGDDDRQTHCNPGRSAANRAATATGARIVFPEWPEGAPEELSDFNDLHLWRSQQLEPRP